MCLAVVLEFVAVDTRLRRLVAGGQPAAALHGSVIVPPRCGVCAWEPRRCLRLDTTISMARGDGMVQYIYTGRTDCWAGPYLLARYVSLAILDVEKRLKFSIRDGNASLPYLQRIRIGRVSDMGYAFLKRVRAT